MILLPGIWVPLFRHRTYEPPRYGLDRRSWGKPAQLSKEGAMRQRGMSWS